VNPDHFVKVFDVLDAGYRNWFFPAFGLIFVVWGTGILAFPNLTRAVGTPFLNVSSKPRAISRYGFVTFALLWTAVALYATLSEHLRHRRMLLEDGCRIVEGPVQHFIPMPHSGHATESFSVAGVPFRYSDFTVTDGFNNTASHGGPVSAGSYVRICYDPTDNAILRLEIRDYKGLPPDYLTLPDIFPKAG
jgi:hypothetical protein